ncbi:MAG: hypothetical protein GEV04_15850 [Actinophytocola sp.]|nr:hypothetical protein [Actinophytocola sp.]
MALDIGPPPSELNRSELAAEAHQLGIQHIEHLHIEELAEAVTETRHYLPADDRTAATRICEP